MRARAFQEPGQPTRRRWLEKGVLHYITHKDNLASILSTGILSHEQVEARGIPFSTVYNADVVKRRRGIQTPAGRSLWGYANLYLQPRNAMLYTVVLSRGVDETVLLSVRRAANYYAPGAFITDGNAASGPTDIVPTKERHEVFQKLHSVDGREYWSDEDGSKRTMMAEILVPDRVPPELLTGVIVGSDRAKTAVEQIVRDSPRSELPVITDPYVFFQPEFESPLTSKLSLVKGDMFFSGMQTLTVSVNTVGVMGAGLASRARYQFPHVYVAYEDLCKRRRLRMGRPVVYKTEAPLSSQLADEPELLEDVTPETWFVLFPTKDDWRRPANREGIVEGLTWLQQNYKAEGITSIAMPALGCGLGRLSWEDMGPIICRALAALDIPAQVYLPAETNVPSNQLTAEFLLGPQRSRLDVGG